MRILVIAAAALAVQAGAAVAATFDFRTGGNNGGPTFNLDSPVTGTPVDGIGIAGAGGTYAFDAIVSTDNRRITRNANGLGVDCNGLVGGGSRACPNEIDGPLDLLTLTFDQPVFFQSLLFTETDSDDDFDLFIDGVLIASEVSIGAVNPFTYTFLTPISGTSISVGADAGTLSNRNEDDFRLGAITVAPVPVPAALPLLAAGLGALVVAARRRTA